MAKAMVDPQSLRARIADVLDDIVPEDPELMSGRNANRGKGPVPDTEPAPTPRTSLGAAR